MVAQERIEKMQVALSAAEADPENAAIISAPARMLVTYHDGPGVQFMDANDRPMLPDLIREVETAVTLFNTLRRILLPSAAPSQPPDLVAASVLDAEPGHPSNPAVARNSSLLAEAATAVLRRYRSSAVTDWVSILEFEMRAMQTALTAAPPTEPTNEGHGR